MVQESDNIDEKKLEFDATGQAVAYISLDQARVLALRHARDNRDFYGRRYAQRDLVWDVVEAEETEDYYEVKLSYRPARGFRGRPGVEQFTIDKAGPIEFRQILDEPVEQRRLRRLAIPAVSILLVGVVAVVDATIIFGGPRGEDRNPPNSPAPLTSSQEGSGIGVSTDGVAPAEGSPAPQIFGSLPPQPPLAGPVSDEGECASLDDASARVQRALTIASTIQSPLPIDVTQVADQAQDAMIRDDIGEACQLLDKLLFLLQELPDTVSTQPETTDALPGQLEAIAAASSTGTTSPTPELIATPGPTQIPTTPAPTPVTSPEPANGTGGMIRGASISGRVTDAESGRPLADVDVRGENILDNGPGANARTGNAGRYTLQGMAPGSYRIRAEAPDDTYVQQYYSDRLGWVSAAVLVVRATETVEDIDFMLGTGGTISGQVSDKITGLPLLAGC